MKLEPRIHGKVWDRQIEAQVRERWEAEKVFRFNPRRRRKAFVIDTPPPYPSGRPWHIGAAAHYSQIDMIARTARMMNYEVLFPIGIDRNGLPVELYTERRTGRSIRSVSREEFIELCKHALDDLEAEMVDIMKAMGLSGEFEGYYRTDSEEYRALTQWTFIKLWEEGLIYEATRPNNYCIDCKTTIADAEVEYEDRPSKLVYVKFKVKETGEDLIVATTRPELLCSCQLVIANPGDERFERLHNLHVIVPRYEREVEVRPHPSAKPEFGSGVMMVCSYGDYTDVLLFRELGLREIVAIDEGGSMTGAAGPYAGLPLAEARKKIVRDLQDDGCVVKIEDIVHRTPVCGRSHTPIEVIPMKEFYLKQLDFLPELKRLAEKMVFHPEAHRKRLLDWIDSVTFDWPISRRRYYATEIPIWYCKACGKGLVPSEERYYRPWKEPPPFKACPDCDGREFIGEERTFDTWMDSSISPLFVSRYRRDHAFFRRTYPNALRPQAKDIVRTWLYYTILRCYQLTARGPFEHVWIMGYGVDEKGERMSKSKGNVIDPYPLLRKFGADTFRFWSASATSLGNDFRCSEEKIAAEQKFLTKLWNLARFISSFPRPRKAELMAADLWILSELSKLIEGAMEGYREFDFFIPSSRVREFTWNTFAAHYVEMVKARAYGEGFTKEEQRATWYTLHTCLRTILLLLAPIAPFATEYLWLQLYGKKSIHLHRLPSAKWSAEHAKFTEPLLRFNSTVWNVKKGRGISLKDPLEMEIPAELGDLSKDLKAMHNLVD